MWRNVSKETGKSKSIPGDLRFSAAFKAQFQNLAIYLVMTESPQDFHSKPWMGRITPQGKTLAWEAVQSLLSCGTGCKKLSWRTHSHGVTNWQELADQRWRGRSSTLEGRCSWPIWTVSQNCHSTVQLLALSWAWLGPLHPCLYLPRIVDAITRDMSSQPATIWRRSDWPKGFIFIKTIPEAQTITQKGRKCTNVHPFLLPCLLLVLLASPLISEAQNK